MQYAGLFSCLALLEFLIWYEMCTEICDSFGTAVALDTPVLRA
jgi:hypothetical protein